MDGGWLPVQGPAQDAAWRAVLRPLAGEFRKVVPELAGEMLEHVKVEMPHLFPDAQSEEEARASGVVNFLLFADSLEHGLDPRDFELPPVTAAVMRAVVHRRGSVAERMRLFRMAHELVWPWFFDHINAAAQDPAQRAAALELATRWLFAYVDNAVTRAEAAYDVEREAWLQGNAAERTAAVEAILARRETDPARATRRLRFEVNRSHVGVVVWVETVRDDGDAHPELMAAISSLGRAVDAQQVLPTRSGAWPWRPGSAGGGRSPSRSSGARSTPAPGSCRPASGWPWATPPPAWRASGRRTSTPPTPGASRPWSAAARDRSSTSARSRWRRWPRSTRTSPCRSCTGC